MASLSEFLKERNVPEDAIAKLEEDKIDHTVLHLMSDEALKNYIPSYGDRIAAYAYCRSRDGNCESSQSSGDRQRSPLLNRLMAGVSRRRRYGHALENNNDTTVKKTSNARKPTRRFNLGWMNFDMKTKSYRQVRSRSGGGTRMIDMEKVMGSVHVLAVGLDLFFPEGKSKFGPKTDFNFRVTDSQLKDIGDSSIGELYDKTKYSLLHLYICSKSIKRGSDEVENKESATFNADPIVIQADTHTETELLIRPQSCHGDYNLNQDSENQPTNQSEVEEQLLPDLTDTGTPTVVFNTRRLRLSRLRGASIGSVENQVPVSAMDDTTSEGQDDRSQNASCQHTGGEQLILASVFRPDQMTVDTPPEKESTADKEPDLDINFDRESSPEPESFHAILTRLSTQVVTDRKNIVNVSRECVLTGGLRGFQRKTFDEQRQLSVKFSGETAIDEGGPSREFLRLLMIEIKSMSIFTGPETRRILDLNYAALRTGTYETVGKMVAYSIVHQGPLPQFFSSMMFDALVEGVEVVKPETGDITDDSYRTKIQQLSCADSVAAFFKAVDAAEDLIELAGCFHLATNFNQRTELADALTHFLLFGRVKQCYDQFCTGLSSLGVLHEIKANSTSMNEAFVYMGGNELTAAVVESLFEVDYSEPGSNRRRQEETTAANWRDFLLDIEDGSEGISLRQVLIFATGADWIPPLGFNPVPTLRFHHLQGLGQEDSENFPFGNTCSNVLDIPVIADFSLFKKNMTAALNVSLFTSE